MSVCGTCGMFVTLTAESGVVACTGCLRPAGSCDCSTEVIEVMPPPKKTMKGKK